MPRRGGRSALLLLSATLILGSCAVSPSTGSVASQSETSELEQPQQSGTEAYQAVRRTDLPLLPYELDGVPFEIWVSEGGLDTAPVIGGSGGPVTAIDGAEFFELGTTRGVSDAEVLEIVEGGVAFGTGTSPGSSRPSVGLIGTDGRFTSLKDVPGSKEPIMLPGAAPFQSLNATGASNFHQVVVWMAVGAGGKQWTLMGWDIDSGEVVELASSASMTLGFSGISAFLVPGLAPPQVNGTYAYFEVAIPQNVYDAAVPGVHFHEIQVQGGESPDHGIAVFRVALDSPGDVVFIGPSAQVIADPVIDEGMFWSTGPLTVIDPAKDGEKDGRKGSNTLAQSGTWKPDGGLEAFDYRNLLAVAAGGNPAAVNEPNLVVWRNEDSVTPLLGFGPGSDWVISDMDASDDYLVIALTKLSVVQGEDSNGVAGPPSWLVGWDLNTGKISGLARSEVAVPDIYISDDLVVWGAAADLTQATADAIGDVTLSGASDAFVWRIGEEKVYQIPSEDDVIGPQLSGTTIAVRQEVIGEDPGWSFIRWIADPEEHSQETE